ncbi:unnamed protein product [Colias eurytheme]|nr:unnamed protein product [Colias eurytheme]
MPLKRSPPTKKALTASPSLDKSASDSRINELADNSSQSSFITQRLKRGREDDLSTELNKLKEEFMAMFSSFMASQQSELQSINATIKEIQQSNNNIDSSIAILTSQNEEYKRKIQEMEIQAKRDKEYITLLEEKVEDLQRDNLKRNIEFKNVPALTNETKEDLINMTLQLSKNIDCKIEKSDIKDIYRVPGFSFWQGISLNLRTSNFVGHRLVGSL